MKGQKEFVVEQVKNKLANFTPYKDNAILLLTSSDLEYIKNVVTLAITGGHIEYSKDRSNGAEVRAYARSMVMNHLKKAKELNGGHSFTSIHSSTSGSSNPVPRQVRSKVNVAPKGVDPDLLPEELREYVKTLI